VLLWRELVFLQLHFIFLQGCNCVDENNEDWCHIQLLNLVLFCGSLSFLGLGHPPNLVGFCICNKSYLPLVFHEYLYLLLCGLDGYSVNVTILVIC